MISASGYPVLGGWIGATRIDGGWIFSALQESLASNWPGWEEGMPTSDADRNCGSLDTTGDRMKNGDCSLLQHPVCRAPIYDGY